MNDYKSGYKGSRDDYRGGSEGREYSRGDRGDRDGGRDEGKKRSFHRKKVCRFCTDSDFHMDYKDVRIMQSFLAESGKLVARRISGTCAFHQRKLTTSVKRARALALIGFVSSGPQEGFLR